MAPQPLGEGPKGQSAATAGQRNDKVVSEDETPALKPEPLTNSL